MILVTSFELVRLLLTSSELVRLLVTSSVVVLIMLQCRFIVFLNYSELGFNKQNTLFCLVNMKSKSVFSVKLNNKVSYKMNIHVNKRKIQLPILFINGHF